MTATLTDFRADQWRYDTHSGPVGADPTSDTSHSIHGTQESAAGVGQTSGNDHSIHDTQRVAVVAGLDRESGSDTTMSEATPSAPTSLSDPLLALAADVLDDAEATKIANENRLRQLTRDELDKDGELRGFGLDESDPDVARLAAIVKLYGDLEKQATKNLEKRLKAHPLAGWVKAQKGIGDKQAARLLAVIGDPYLNEQTGQPRTVSQLWAYCGHGDPSRKKAKGMSQEDLFALGNPDAKKRVWLITGSCLKAQGHYADVYYDRKNQTVDRTHATECKRCGPSGKPAQPGSPWPDAHRHADALRIVGKEILRDLWREAKRIHEDGEAYA